MKYEISDLKKLIVKLKSELQERNQETHEYV